MVDGTAGWSAISERRRALKLDRSDFMRFFVSSVGLVFRDSLSAKCNRSRRDDKQGKCATGDRLEETPLPSSHSAVTSFGKNPRGNLATKFRDKVFCALHVALGLLNPRIETGHELHLQADE